MIKCIVKFEFFETYAVRRTTFLADATPPIDIPLIPADTFGGPLRTLLHPRCRLSPGHLPGFSGDFEVRERYARGSIRDPIVGFCRKFPREHMCTHKGITVGSPPRGTLRDIPSPEIFS